MNILGTLFSTALFAAAPMVANSATITSYSYAENAAGNRFLNSTANAPSAQRLDNPVAGVLDRVTIWLNVASNAFAQQEDLVFALWQREAFGIPQITDQLATTTLSYLDLLAGPTVTGGDGGTYVAATWDMLSLGIAVDQGDDLIFRAHPTGPSGQYQIGANDCGMGNADFCPTPASSAVFSGTPTALSNSGTSAIGWSMVLTVDDGMPDGPSQVPLPATALFVLTGLAGLGVLRLRKSPQF